ncbi:MAG: TolC family protein [Terriglobia bacterium]
MNRSVGIMLATLVILGVSTISPSAAEAPSIIQLTLADAVRLALQANPEVQNANLTVAERQEDVRVARSGLLPQATLKVSDTAERINLGSTFGKALPIFPHHVGPFQVFDAGPEFSTPIFDLTLWRSVQASRASKDASRHDEQSVREQNTLLVVSQYLAALRAAEQVKTVQSRVDLALALSNQAQQLEENGIGTNLDTVRANVELQNARQALLVAQADSQKALYGLARLLDLDPRQQIQLTDQSYFSATPEFPGDASASAALASRPELQSLLSQEAAARFEQRSAREQRLPSLSVGGTWDYQGTSLPSSIPTYAIAATVTVPLWTSGRIRAQEAKAGLEVRELANQQRAQRDAIVEELKSAEADLTSGRSQVDVARSGLALADKELGQARERFAAGIANNIELTTAQDSLARANDNLIDALYRYNLAHAQLAHATGQMESLYAK